MRKKINLFLCIITVLTISCKNNSVKPDNDFDVSVKDPQLKTIHPKVLFDEAHKNHHKIANTYKPFATLINNDGCIVKVNDKTITSNILAGTDIYIIATAMGKEDPGSTSPFTKEEIDAVEAWVKNGGSALIITEHFPFGLAMAPLLNPFGVQVHNGYTEDTLLNNKEVMDALLFQKVKGNLNPAHPMLNNVERINTFTGSSVKGDSTWTPLIIFTPNAQNFNVKVDVKKDDNDIITSVEYADFYSANGYAQGICKQYGKGRIVVLAESAFITAQTDKNGNKFGINIPNTGNKQFALNLIRWLAVK
jgi:hypothetical protein